MAQHLVAQRFIGSRLGGDATLQSLLPPAPGDSGPLRLYPGRLPQGVVYPAFSYHFVAAPRGTKTEAEEVVMGRPVFLIRGWSALSALELEPALNRMFGLLHKSFGSNSSGTVLECVWERDHGPFSETIEGTEYIELGAYYRFTVQ